MRTFYQLLQKDSAYCQLQNADNFLTGHVGCVNLCTCTLTVLL